MDFTEFRALLNAAASAGAIDPRSALFAALRRLDPAQPNVQAVDTSRSQLGKAILNARSDDPPLDPALVEMLMSIANALDGVALRMERDLRWDEERLHSQSISSEVLKLLLESGNSRPSDISRRLDRERSQISRVLRALERRGIVSRRKSILDGRGYVYAALPDVDHLLKVEVAEIAPSNPVAVQAVHDNSSRPSESAPPDLGRRVAALQRLALFSLCTPVELNDLAAGSELTRVEASAQIVTEGAPSDAAFCVLSGRVGILRAGKLLAELTAGDCFGELALLSRRNWAASVRAETAVELLGIRQVAFDTVLARRPDLARRLLMQVADTVLEVSESSSALVSG